MTELVVAETLVGMKGASGTEAALIPIEGADIGPSPTSLTAFTPNM